MEFDFNKKTTNSTESKKSTNNKQTKAQASTTELTNNTSENSTNIKETTKGKKAVVMYVGNGTWRDSKGEHWSRTEKPNVRILSTRSYDMSEYDNRDDLKFMVKYGEMKLSLV